MNSPSLLVCGGKFDEGKKSLILKAWFGRNKCRFPYYLSENNNKLTFIDKTRKITSKLIHKHRRYGQQS